MQQIVEVLALCVVEVNKEAVRGRCTWVLMLGLLLNCVWLWPGSLVILSPSFFIYKVNTTLWLSPLSITLLFPAQDLSQGGEINPCIGLNACMESV